MTDKIHPRPLSPHLQVYRLPPTALISILHRMTGAALAVGSLMVIWWLWAAVTTISADPMIMGMDPGMPPPATDFDNAMAFASSPLGILLLFGWSFALYLHLLNGIRHLVWDTGRLFEKEIATKSSYAMFGGALVLTMITWVMVYV